MNPDIAVIKACKQGDERAYYALFSCCYSIMMGICMRYLGDEGEANGAVNKAFLKIVENLNKWDDKRSFEAWAKTITVNTALDAFRKKSTANKNMPLSPIESTGENFHAISLNGAEEKFDAEQLEQMILELPEMHRQVFNLFAIDGYSHKEVSDMLDCTESSSKWYLYQARKLLQDKLESFLMEEKKYQHG